MPTSAACSECCADFRESRRLRQKFPNRECERLDCALANAMLEFIDGCGHPEMANRLDSLREQILRCPDRAARQQEWDKMQQKLKGLEEHANIHEQPIVSDKWDHSIPAEVEEVLAEFDLDHRAWLRCEENWIQAKAQNKRLVALCGPARSGKTCAAARWLSRVEGGRFVTAARLVALREAVGSEDRKELYVIRKAPALVIDDLDRTPLLGPDAARLTEVVRTRISAGLPTVCTMISGRNLPSGLAGRARAAVV
jgi:hypothetical protein